MTKVLHLGKFYPPDKGGIEAVTAFLARGAAAEGFETTVLCFGGKSLTELFDQGVTIRRVSAIKIASQPLSLCYFREAVSRANQADIVHVHLPNMLAALAILRIDSGPRVIVHWHSDVIGKRPITYITQVIEKLILKRANKIICTSQAYANASKALQRYHHKIVVIPIGTPNINSTDANRETLLAQLAPKLAQHVQGRPLVLAVGRLVPYKGFTVLINAAKKLSSEAAIVIVGCGPQEHDLKQQIKKVGVSNRLMLIGSVDDKMLQALFRLTSIFCMPSVERSEAFGVAIIEAMAHSLPIVATNIPGSGVPWVNLHQESGLNVTPGNAEELAKALDTLLSDSTLRQSLGQGSYKRYLENFTEQRSIQATLALYKHEESNH
jgi:glycosyltransferase involved in cell wall biosynthesis